MPSSTRWRILINGNQSGFVHGIAEVEMHTSIGGADVCSGGTPSAFSTFGGYAAANAFDDDNATFWDANSYAQGWIEYQFDAAQDIVEFAVTAPPSGNTDDVPTDFELQYYDGADWVTTLFRRAEWGWTAGEKRTYSASNPTTSKVLWRILISAVDGASFAGVAEVQMRTTLGGADQCSGGTAASSSPYDGSSLPANAFADDAGVTEWGAKVITDAWIGYLFASPKNIVQITIQARGAGVYNQSPTAFKLQYWDGSAWVDSFSVSGSTDWGQNEIRTFPESPVIVHMYVHS